MASNPPGFMKPPHVPFLTSKMSEKGKLFKLQLRRRHTSGIEERPSRSKERLEILFIKVFYGSFGSTCDLTILQTSTQKPETSRQENSSNTIMGAMIKC
ncbi:uncharacterized protein NPIL_454271 [Nephila pilipes]|uniref:Uncharacterized protein n=1 Tax=Nephila pilipes TaxID=299642 RepID=A0A8X6NTW5_NEPPI|nr:uncharacterized protein NPIL_454271 [Nephila pilipes]